MSGKSFCFGWVKNITTFVDNGRFSDRALIWYLVGGHRMTNSITGNLPIPFPFYLTVDARFMIYVELLYISLSSLNMIYHFHVHIPPLESDTDYRESRPIWDSSGSSCLDFAIAELHDSPLPTPSPLPRPAVAASALFSAQSLVLAVGQADHDVCFAGA